MLLVFNLLTHCFFGSIGWFLFLRSGFSETVALFGAVTFTYQAYHIKQQPCIVYTLAWFPWMLYGLQTNNALLSSTAIGMICLSGYYPLALYLIPAGLATSNAPVAGGVSLAVGLLIGLPQIVPFLRYLPKTIRKAVSSPVEVGYWERNFYPGLAPILLVGLSFEWFLIGIPVVVGLSFKKWLPRVHQRLYILSAYLLIWFSLGHLKACSQSTIYGLLALQAFDLWFHNRNLIPTRPFSELPNRPSWAFDTRLTRYLHKNLGNDRVSGLPYPLFTGLINNFRTLGYSGGMQLKLMAKFRNDKDPNGGGCHDWFRSNQDDRKLDEFRVRYAYSTQKLSWEHTEIRHLYRNPRMSAG